MPTYEIVSKEVITGRKVMRAGQVVEMREEDGQPLVDIGAAVPSDLAPSKGPFAGLMFTPAAKSKVETAGLTKADFKDVEPEGSKGEYTAKQVDDLIAARGSEG